MHPSRFSFVLVPEFSLYGLVPAIEALRIASQNSETPLYHWSLRSIDGKPVRASCGMAIEVEGSLSGADGHDAVVVCAGNHPLEYADRHALHWLNYQERHGKILISIDSGSFLLAEAGLLDGYRATVHWELLQLFQEQYPNVRATEALFVNDRNRMTCAGGIAALDMMLHLIEMQHGPELARIVANGFVHMRRSDPNAPQVISPRIRVVEGDRRVSRLLGLMERHTQCPLEIRTLAEQSHLSIRQMERIVRRLFNMTPEQLYSRVRLDSARVHLFHGKLPVKEIAAVCGFASASAFCRAFKKLYGASPLAYRRQHAFDDLERFRAADTFARILTHD